MGQFLGSHLTKLDAKGRTSVPAAFRAALREDSDGALVLRPSHQHSCVEGWPASLFAALAPPVDSLDLFSDDHDDMTTALYADACPVEPDKDGRIIVPESLIRHAGLGDAVVFMGKGRTFQIWEPEAAAKRAAEARERARSRAITLPGTSPPGARTAS